MRKFSPFLAAMLVAMAAPAVARAQNQSQPLSGDGAAPPAASTAPSRAASAGIAPAVAQRASDAAKAAAAAINNKSSDTADAAADADEAAPPPSALPKALGGQGQNPSEVSTPTEKMQRQKMKAALSRINPERMMRDREYREASVLFPGFCKDWEQKLRDREVNNLQHIIWRLENGFETALYTGYSTVESCESHQSTDGYSIGKITYEEYHYLVKAKTVDEAKTTKATPVDDTHTTEIFRWDRGKWFY
ncbi:MAG TPA: hypothetical protein VJX23_06535 [Candidatus Binataceae bacterium]|nr:hypothetical protein [Candidatus Binataceae bacterium]